MDDSLDKRDADGQVFHFDIDKYPRLKAEETETEDPLGIHDADGRVFRVGVHPCEGLCYTYILGDFSNNLEIRVNIGSHRIIDIESVYVNRIYEIPFLRRPGFEEMDYLVFHSSGACYNEDGDGKLFLLNLSDRELDILLSPSGEAAMYYPEGRCWFFYNDDYELLYIKITNLTDEEYRHFHSYVSST